VVVSFCIGLSKLRHPSLLNELNEFIELKRVSWFKSSLILRIDLQNVQTLQLDQIGNDLPSDQEAKQRKLGLG
jgi:hypothetical protein